ncbi:MAG: trigger factor [Phycisphaerales bacterium]|jgi:trigger factor
MKLKPQEVATDAPPKPDIKEYVKVEDTSANLKTLMIDVPSEVVQVQLTAALNTIAKEAVLPGFRRGRVPHRLLERRYGDAIKREAGMTLLNNMTTEALQEYKIKVLGEPRAKNFDDIEIEPGKPVHFEVEVEVLPDFDLPDFTTLEVLRPSLEMPEGIVDEEIQKLKVNEGSLEERDAPEPGDYLTGRGVMVDQDGTEHYNIDGAVVRIPQESDEGKGMVLGVAVDDFAKQLGSPKASDTVTIKVKGPEQHELEALRGKDLTVTFEVDRIDRIIPAELADVVARLGLSGEGQLREIIEQRLAENAKVQQQTAMQSQVARFMLDSIELPLPDRLSSAQAERNLERRRMELLYRGVDPQEIEQHLAEMRAESAESAVSELKLFFILSKVAEEFEVVPTGMEVANHITELATRRGVSPDAMRQEIVQADKMSAVRVQVRDHKTMETILEKATIKDVSTEEYNEYARSLKKN